MRVAIVQEHLDARRGGAETSVSEMATHLVRLGIDVTLICADAPAASPLPVCALPSTGISKLARTRRFIDAAADLCLARRFDVVHAVTPCPRCHVYQPRGGTYEETIRRSAALPAAGWLRPLRRLGRRLNRRQRYLLRLERSLLGGGNPPYVAAVSRYVQRQVLVSFRDYPPERLRVVFNGVDIEPLPADRARRERAALRARLHVGGSTLVLFVAHNFRLKGLRELLYAAASGPGRDLGFLVAVAGRDRTGPYQRLASALDIAPRVRFLGSAEPPTSLYAAADVLAHPTWYDPCSRVALEALACGLPVVTTRYNGAAELIDELSAGAVIDDPRFAEELAAAIGGCAAGDVRERCRALAPAIGERVSMARHVQELVALYQSAARDGARADAAPDPAAT